MSGLRRSPLQNKSFHRLQQLTRVGQQRLNPLSLGVCDLGEQAVILEVQRGDEAVGGEEGDALPGEVLHVILLWSRVPAGPPRPRPAETRRVRYPALASPLR